MAADRRLVILGATGTVGRRALELLAELPDAPRVVALAAHRDTAGLAEAAAALHDGRVPTFLASVPSERDALLALLRDGDGYDVCLNAVVGAAGLPYSLAVAEAGRDLALANKESLVCAGPLLTAAMERNGGRVLPVDSEHAALQRLVGGRSRDELRRLVLTASGGALRDRPLSALAEVTPDEALAHPNWTMGPRITVDSATMMNKAFEVLEAVHLFGVSPDRVEVLLHRESVVHGLVEFRDGTLLAHLGPPDMGFPIQQALTWPEVPESPLVGFDPRLMTALHFEEVDPARWPALALGWEAARRGGYAGAVLNAADEVAVEAFLAGRIAFPAIAEVCATVLAETPPGRPSSLADLEAADRSARERAAALLSAPSSPTS